MFKLFMLGWVITGVIIATLLVSLYKTIVEVEDGSDWFYE